jgi:hypothetical protein
MTIEHLIAAKLEEETEWLDDLIAQSISGIERDFGPDPVYREQLARLRREKLDQLQSKLLDFFGRLN